MVVGLAVDDTPEHPVPLVSDLQGLWRRSLIAWPDGRRDTATSVSWLQGPRTYIDLRQPAPPRGFAGARRLGDLTMEDCAWLARQEGFAGRFGFDGRHFEWARAIDFQPTPIYSDAGSLWWDGDVLVETGRDVAYVEHWHRDASDPVVPSGAALLRDARGTAAALLRVGSVFMYARDRAVVPPAHKTLAECVAAAPTVEQARALVDCEISIGHAGADGFRIVASSLPFRVGDVLAPRLTKDGMSTMDRADTGDAVLRSWTVVDLEGEPAALGADAPRPP